MDTKTFVLQKAKSAGTEILDEIPVDTTFGAYNLTMEIYHHYISCWLGVTSTPDSLRPFFIALSSRHGNHHKHEISRFSFSLSLFS